MEDLHVPWKRGQYCRCLHKRKQRRNGRLLGMWGDRVFDGVPRLLQSKIFLREAFKMHTMRIAGIKPVQAREETLKCIVRLMTDSEYWYFRHILHRAIWQPFQKTQYRNGVGHCVIIQCLKIIDLAPRGKSTALQGRSHVLCYRSQ